jgi:hypothetical protein
MRGFQAIIAAALIAMQPLALQKPERLAFAQQRNGDAALLDRNAIACTRAALVASLWPEARPCLIAAFYGAAPVAPAIPLAGDVRGLQAQLGPRFGAITALVEPRLAA